jgi:hypothetical protein
MGNRRICYVILRQRKTLRGFACPPNQSPLKNFDQLLGSTQIDRNVEGASVAELNSYYVIAVFVRLRKYGGYPAC